MRLSARARLALSFTLLFGSIVVALTIASYLLVRHELFSDIESSLRVAIGGAAMSSEHELNEHRTQQGGEEDIRNVLSDSQSALLADTQILLLEGDRQVAYKGSNEHGLDLRTLSPARLTAGGQVQGLQIAHARLPATKFQTSYDIYAAKEIGPALEQLSSARRLLLLFVPVGLAFAALAGYFVAGHALRPIADLARTIDRLNPSDLSARVLVGHRGDEMAQLAARVNALLDRIENAFGIQRRFMADASHELRTPVTIALSATQATTRDRNHTLLDCEESLHLVEAQMLRLTRVIQDMFFLSQADASSLKIERKEMFLDDAISEATRAAKTLAAARKQTVVVKSLTEARCLGDEELLKRAILILLDNAIKFTPGEGRIELALTREGPNWVCNVTDSGYGISHSAQERIFERFFRDAQAGEKAPGAGLGLAIAESIAETHGGTLTLVESRPGFTHFALSIPALDHEPSADGSQANSFAVKI